MSLSLYLLKVSGLSDLVDSCLSHLLHPPGHNLGHFQNQNRVLKSCLDGCCCRCSKESRDGGWDLRRFFANIPRERSKYTQISLPHIVIIILFVSNHSPNSHAYLSATPKVDAIFPLLESTCLSWTSCESFDY